MSSADDIIVAQAEINEAAELTAALAGRVQEREEQLLRKAILEYRTGQFTYEKLLSAIAGISELRQLLETIERERRQAVSILDAISLQSTPQE